MNIKQKYENCVNEYVEIFCNKHELDFDGWVGNYIGEVAYMNDLYIDFFDIRYDIDNKIDKHRFLEWYYYRLEKNIKVNYRSYVKGAR